jgi:hypothetical protein
MRGDNLIAMRRKPFAPPTSDNRHGFLIVPNLLRGLVPSGLDQIWVADITYIRLASTEYRQRLAGHDITVSMSRPGNPYDNAKAESFMKTLKTEEVDGRSFKDLKDARRSIRVFIDTIYNTERLHSALGYCPPLEFATNFALALSPK